ncbi:hypothetical protein KF707_02025 [Candidatus Obscuribacterales bacterium]|nr:hypothetical protein [Candidatus Obscuribacterales bacterium]MBX3134982.1 hypothetical protein [Candidatus Obscuribacterales bacterium]MBX3151760.1 hypothetical protein [Candidatus Obscuribacterales bacterium]
MKERLQKGQLLVVKVAPLYEKEYFYQITSAGEKLVRADLFHSPKVKKNWTIEELEILMEHGIVRVARDDEKPPEPPSASSQTENDDDD